MKYKNLKTYWNDVAALKCIVTRAPNPTLHHIHGASVMRELGLITGMALKQSDWLVIPLAAHLHTGQYGVDGCLGVESWEIRFGTQVDFMDDVCRRLNFNAWAAAGVNRDPFVMSIAS